MKEDPLYEWYVAYLEDKLERKLLNKGEVEMSKISEHLFQLYKKDVNKIEWFRNKQEMIYSKWKRKNKLDFLEGEI